MENIENPEHGDDTPNINDIRKERVRESVPSFYVFEGYCDNLDIKPEELKSKKILDVGSGADEDFSRRAAQFGAEVISLNPKLSESPVRQGIIFLEDWQGKSVAGIAQALPFKDNTFDYVVSHWAIPMWLPKANGERIESEVFVSIKEMCRVLKDDGEIRIWPIEEYSKEARKKDLIDILENNLGVKTLKWLGNNGFKATLGEYKEGRTESSPLIIKKKD